MFTFPLVVKVPAHLVTDGKQAFYRALEQSGLKLETIARLMGGQSYQAVQDSLLKGGPKAWHLLMLALDADGRRFLACFLQEYAELAGVEDHDAIAARLSEVVASFNRRDKTSVTTHTDSKGRPA